MAENGPPKGPENTFKASHVESEGFQALAVKPGGQPYGGERSGKGEIDQASRPRHVDAPLPSS